MSTKTLFLLTSVATLVKIPGTGRTQLLPTVETTNFLQGTPIPMHATCRTLTSSATKLVYPGHYILENLLRNGRARLFSHPSLVACPISVSSPVAAIQNPFPALATPAFASQTRCEHVRSEHYHSFSIFTSAVMLAPLVTQVYMPP